MKPLTSPHFPSSSFLRTFIQLKMKAGDVVSIVSNTLSGVVTVLGVLADQMNKKRERRYRQLSCSNLFNLLIVVSIFLYFLPFFLKLIC